MLIVGHLCVCNFLVLIANILYFYGTLYMPYRVESYIQGGLGKDIVDPDDGENIRRKRRRLGILTQMISMTPLAPLLSINSCFLQAPLHGNGSLMTEHFYLSFPWLIC